MLGTDPAIIEEVRARFAHVDSCPFTGERIFFENAGGALTLNSVVETSAKFAAIPDNQGRDNPASKELDRLITKARDDAKVFFHASSGQVFVGESGTELLFRIISAAIMGSATGGQVLGSTLEHPASSSACKVWAETADACVGCGTCNLVCPTCYCFDVEDTVDVTVTHGSRERAWDGCMLRRFSEVAGGEVFREDTAARQRHRVYRKFKYISDQTSQPWCVGCGRCMQACTAGISIVQIVNRLVNDHNRDAVPA